MSFALRATAAIGMLLIVAFVVLAIISILGGFDHRWSDPPV
jgi:hypothetical protein